MNRDAHVPFGATSEMWRIWGIGEGSLYRTVCQAR